MKKTVLLLLLFSLLTLILKTTAPILSVAVETKPCFARVKYNNVYLYKTPNQMVTYENVFCFLEPSYFVEVLKDENKLFFKVNYLNLEGYVLKTQVECVFETPTTPYPDAVFYSTNFSNIILRTTPKITDADTTSLAVLPPNSKLTFLGKITGEVGVENLGNVWYYCNYENNDGVLTGYVYAPYTHNFTPLKENVEATTIVEYGYASNINAFLNIAPKYQFVLVLVTILPSIILVVLFLKKSKVSIN